MVLAKVGTLGQISVPELMTDVPSWCRLMAGKINQILRGKTNNVGEVTLTANAATSTITVAIGTFGNNTVFVFDPTTATSATAFGSGGFYVSTRTPDTGTYIITHPNTADANKTFKVAYIG